MNGEYEFDPGGMPSAEIAEEAILCCFMRYPQRFIGLAAAEGIDAACFYKLRPMHTEILAYAAEYPEHEEIDIQLLTQAIELKGTLGRVGGPSAVASLIMREPVEYRWTAYTNQLREAKARRLKNVASAKLAEDADSDEAINTMKDALEAMTKAISGKNRSKGSKTTADDFIRRWTSDHETGEIPGSATGFHEIDAICGGMRPGELWMIGGKTSRGKSVMMLQIAADFLSRGERVAIFSLEMMAHEVTGRLVCAWTGEVWSYYPASHSGQA